MPAALAGERPTGTAAVLAGSRDGDRKRQGKTGMVTGVVNGPAVAAAQLVAERMATEFGKRKR